jgi:porphobilinogen deaminase
VRAGDSDIRALFGILDPPPIHRCVLAERALLAAFHAGCDSPVAALASQDGIIRAELFAEDGSAHITGSGTDPAAIARDLLTRAPDASDSQSPQDHVRARRSTLADDGEGAASNPTTARPPADILFR